MASVNLTAGATGVLIGTVVIGGVLYWIYANRKELADKVNPMSDKNIASQTADKLTQYATGDPNQSFGGWLYDLVHPDAYDPKQYTGTPKPTSDNPNYYSTSGSNATAAKPAPATSINPFQRLGEKIGSSLFDLFNPKAGLQGWTPALDGATGRMVLVPPMTPVTWVIIAGVSYALYVSQQKTRRRRRR